ncbi:MAG: hypothetical protein VX738_03430 [Planctomycetota bacterium]|nr:hypothetical protein [Planctomycetota bacterium]
MTRTIILGLLVSLISAPLTIVGQTLADAEKVSQRTGRPIFVMAGRDT